MSKSILLIDDQERFLGTLKKVLETVGYLADMSSDATDALNLISLQKYDAIICDIQMPNLSGFDFLKKASKLTIAPIILMTGFAELADAERATREGAKAFIAKPFTLPDIKKTLDEALAEKNTTPSSAPSKQLDDQYFPLTIDEFVTGKKINHDLFVRVNSSKYLKIAHGGEDLSPERVSKFKEKGLKFLYLTREDYKSYLAFVLNMSKRVSQSKSIEMEKRVAFLRVASDLAMKGMFLGVVKEPDLTDAKQIVGCIHQLTSEDETLVSLLEALKSSSDTLYSHAMGVSVLAVMMARALNWTSQSSIVSVGLAGFFHDIGKKELPSALLSKSRLEFSQEEVKLYESHPARGANLLAATPKIPAEVVQAVLQHHEGCSGLGFPKHLMKNRIIPIARILAIADEFVNLVLPGPSQLALSPMEVFQRMSMLKGDFFDPEYLNALASILEKKT